MSSRRLPTLGFLTAVILMLAVGACTRAASTPLPGPGTGGQSSSALTDQQATMESVRSALLTQTAQAMAAGEGEASPTATPTDVVVATAPPTAATVIVTTPTTGSGVTEYIVLPGEWLYSISRKFNVSPESIIELNGLVAPYELTAGMVLKIPAPVGAGEVPIATASITSTPLAGGTTYIVQPGEWVYSIARKFGIDPELLIQANNLQAPYTVYPGQELIIP